MPKKAATSSVFASTCVVSPVISLAVLMPVFAVLAGCANHAAPAIPDGAERPINTGFRAAVASPRNADSTRPLASANRQAEPSVAVVQAATPALIDAPPSPVPAALYFAKSTDATTLDLLRRWAWVADVGFTWAADVDYPLTPRMREIQASNLPDGVAAIREALRGVQSPISIDLLDRRISVSSASTTTTAVSQPIKDSIATKPTVPSPPALPAVIESVPVLVTQLRSPAVSVQPVVVSPSYVPSIATQTSSVLDAKPIVATPLVPRSSWDHAARASAGALPMAWKVGSSQSLRSIAEAWGNAAGVRVVWEASTDYPVTDVIRAGTYTGTFKEALSQLAVAFGQLATPLGMKFQEQGRVVRVFNI